LLRTATEPIFSHRSPEPVDAAIRSCQLALTADALAEKPYYLLAQIAEVQGKIADAKNFLKKIL
jgi:hypothetical protein